MKAEIWNLKSHISDFWVGVQMKAEIWNLKADFSDFWVGVQMKPETWGGLLKSDQISLLIWTVDQNSEFWILKTEPFFTVDWWILSSKKVREGSQLNTEHIYGSKWGHTEVWYLKCETWSELGTKSEVELGRFNRGRTHIWQQWAARCGSGERAASSLRSSWTWPTTFDAPDFHQASQFRSNFQKSDRKGRGACTHQILMNKNQWSCEQPPLRFQLRSEQWLWIQKSEGKVSSLLKSREISEFSVSVQLRAEKCTAPGQNSETSTSFQLRSEISMRHDQNSEISWDFSDRSQISVPIWTLSQISEFSIQDHRYAQISHFRPLRFHIISEICHECRRARRFFAPLLLDMADNLRCARLSSSFTIQIQFSEIRSEGEGSLHSSNFDE